MYEGGRGAGVVLGSSIVLPNTGGNGVLRFMAVAGIVVGATILVTSLVRVIAARAYKS